MIIVTGASRGLGQAIAERLVERGEEVVGLARNTSGLNMNTIQCDVSDYSSVKNASKEVKRMKMRDLPIGKEVATLEERLNDIERGLDAVLKK